MRGSVGRLAHSTIGEFGIVMVYLLSSPPMHLSFRTLVEQYLANYEDADFVTA